MRRMLLAAVLVPATAFAQSTPAPDVVVTATRIPTVIDQVPAGVTVIDRATIEARGYTSLADAISTVPGLHLSQSGGPGGNASVFIRGTNSNHVLVLRDGMPLNDPSDPGGQFNFGVDTLGDIERIEVVRGPMSSLYGSGAIGGVINLITRQGKGAPTGTAEFAVGLPIQVRGAASVSGASGRFHYSLSAETRAESGFDTTPRRETVYTGARNPYNSQGAAINLGYDLSEDTTITASLRGRNANFRLDTLGYDPNRYRGFDTSLSGRLAVTHLMLDGAWESTLAIGRLQTERHYKEPLEAADPTQTQADSRYHGRRTELRWDNTLHLPPAGPAADIALIFGASHTDDSANAVLDGNFGGFAYRTNNRNSAASDAGHAGAQATLWHRLTLTGDIRMEEGRYGGGATTWRLGGVFAVPEAFSRFKAAYGTAFRAPSLYDLFGVDSGGYIGNPTLKPERSTGYELGWAIDLPRLGGTGAFGTLDVTYFNNRISDLIQTVYGPGFLTATTENVARARTQGVETSFTMHPAPWLDATIGYTWTETRDLTTNTALLKRPRDEASIALRATPIEHLTIAPELVYTSSFLDFLTDDNGLATGVGRSHPGVILNLAANYVLNDRLTLFAIGRNIGGSHFEPASGFQTPGTSVLAGVRTRF